MHVRGRAGDLEGPWSTPQNFMVRPTKVVRSRGFDSEDDGPIALTTGASDAAAMAGAATALVVGAPFAMGGHGKGLALRSTAASNTKAYKNHDILLCRSAGSG